MIKTETISSETRSKLLDSYKKVRNVTDLLCKPLEIEDYVVQSSEDASPVKWNIGHTTWFFEKLLLEPFIENYKPYDPIFHFINNSYYETLGKRIERVKRGILSRPTVNEIYKYRSFIDEQMSDLIKNIDDERWESLAALVVLGLNHEQQHQELMLTDLKDVFASNPFSPSYNHKDKSSTENNSSIVVPEITYVEFQGGMTEIGASEHGFAYDCERPRHKVFVHPFKLMNRLVTCGEFLQFIEDGGYHDAPLWLSDAWAHLQNVHWEHPRHWRKIDGVWNIFTLSGLKLLDKSEPVCHVSYYEAAAFARWKRKRMPTEIEWEVAAMFQVEEGMSGNFMDSNIFHPQPLSQTNIDHQEKVSQLFGDVWEWTSSAFLPYPGYLQEEGALGEYNGKFMNNQKVLRGGSCVTPFSHFRISYRNFFQPEKRWQITGFRLASDL